MSLIYFFIGLLTLVLIYGTLTMALNLHFGYSGMINFGMVAFLAVGAYTYAIATSPPPGAIDSYLAGFDLPVWVGTLLAIGFTGLFGYLIAKVSLRLSGEYLALTTFAFAEVVYSIFNNEKWLGNGPLGMDSLSRPLAGLASGNVYQVVLFLIVAALTFSVFVVLERLSGTPFGLTLRAIRENESAVLAAGKNAHDYKLQAFVLGSMIAGLAGAMFAWFYTLVVPDLFLADVTFTVWIAMVLGGVGSNRGCLLGILLLICFQELTRFFQSSPDTASLLISLRTIMLGFLFVVVLRLRPGGLLGERHRIEHDGGSPAQSTIASGMGGGPSA